MKLSNEKLGAVAPVPNLKKRKSTPMTWDQPNPASVCQLLDVENDRRPTVLPVTSAKFMYAPKPLPSQTLTPHYAATPLVDVTLISNDVVPVRFTGVELVR